MPGYELINHEERNAVISIFDTGSVLSRYGFDSKRKYYKVNEFENKFAKYMNCKYAHATMSGTIALKVALVALGVKRGDEVITSCFTFVATAEAILDLGAKPVFTEIDETLTMDVKDLERKITKKTKVIIPVHMYGFPCDMDGIMKIAKRKNIKVLEDVAQACGGSYKGRKLGTIGDAGCFSFDYVKAITTGEGGMVITNDKETYKLCSEYTDHGHENNPNLPRGEDTRTIWGMNYRMNEIQGALGIVQLSRLNKILKSQKDNKRKIVKMLKIERGDSNYRQGETCDSIIILCQDEEDADKLIQSMKTNGISTKNLPDAIKWHFAGEWGHMIRNTSKWKKSEKILKRAVSLAVKVNMTELEISQIKKSLGAA